MTPERILLGRDLAGRAAALEQARVVLQAGEIALLPAEGLYGLHARALLPESAARLRVAKGVPSGRPFILLIGAPAHVAPLVASFPGPSARLVREVWPAPLTLLLPAAPQVPSQLCRDGMIAVRCPANIFLRELILSLDEPLLSTSANLSGAEPPREIASVAAAVRGRCAILVDAGPLPGKGSTIARPEVDGNLTILRCGLWVPPD